MGGFQFTPTGISSLGDVTGTPLDIPRAKPTPAPQKPPEAQRAEAKPAPAAAPPTSPERDAADIEQPFNVEKAARARLKVLNEEIKRLTKLKRERDRLQRILKAAREKPADNLRKLRSA